MHVQLHVYLLRPDTPISCSHLRLVKFRRSRTPGRFFLRRALGWRQWGHIRICSPPTRGHLGGLIPKCPSQLQSSSVVSYVSDKALQELLGRKIARMRIFFSYDGAEAPEEEEERDEAPPIRSTLGLRPRGMSGQPRPLKRQQREGVQMSPDMPLCPQERRMTWIM